MIDWPDIYYLPGWGELYAQKEQGDFEYYTLENEHGIVLYPYIKRKCPVLYKEELYYDIITPYGFNGPYMKEANEGSKERLLEEFEEDFEAYVKEHRIIAEYIRFCPWFQNHKDFGEYYNLRPNGQTVAVDLRVEDLLKDCSTMRKKAIKKAVKLGVRVEFDFEGKSVEGLCDLYKNVVEKNNIDRYYEFSVAFFKEHFKKLKGHVCIINAFYDTKLISSCLFVYYKKNMHCIIIANDYEYISMNGNSLIILKAMEWGKANGFEFLHLYGGSNLVNIMNFKSSFTKYPLLGYYIGTKIHQENIYLGIVQETGINNSNYFPAYRGDANE